MSHSGVYDAIVIGGGFYGCAISIYLAKNTKYKKILLVEREAALLKRASYTNQARVHNGYHYPRSFTTAFRSRINLPRFLNDWPEAVKTDFTKLYAVARRNSQVTPRQFERFCREIGAELYPAPENLSGLFNPRLIESVYCVKEYAFDTTILAKWAEQELHENNVEVIMSNEVVSIAKRNNKELLDISIRSLESSEEKKVSSELIFNCTYSGLNQIHGEFEGTRAKLKHEITEMALIEPPIELLDLGITVMDGPFFSMMPFPARKLHTLSHVRYTPHQHWEDSQRINPYRQLDKYDQHSRVDRMIRDTARYIPSVLRSKYKDSLFEIKTVLIKNEGDDGRPILYEQSRNLPGVYSILGGKIDNIYDILEMIRTL